MAHVFTKQKEEQEQKKLCLDKRKKERVQKLMEKRHKT